MSKTKAFTIRADEDLIKSFHHACTNTDTTASQAVRAFMRDYIKKNGQGDLFAKSSKQTLTTKNKGQSYEY